MRFPNILPLLLASCSPVIAASPVNDLFASRTPVVGSSISLNATNEEATEEAGENTRVGLIVATVWWSWQAPSSGWVKVDTGGSSFDTVLQISSGATLAGQVIEGFNDQGPGAGFLDTSSVNFMASAGTVYNIAVGGNAFFGLGETGDITLHIAMGAAGKPAYFPATLSFSTPIADITSAAVAETCSFTIQSAGGSGTGTAGAGLDWDPVRADGKFVGEAAHWDVSQPQGGSPQITFTVPRYTAAGEKSVWLKIMPDGIGPALIFSGPDGGTGYVLPPPPAVARTLQVINNGPVDGDPPHLTALAITPASADVTTAPATLQISADFADTPAGVAAVKVTLSSSGTVRDLTTALSLTSGTITNGRWAGAIAVPVRYPTDNYSVSVEATDVAQNDTTYGASGAFEIPGGNVDVPIIGGGAYETWAYSYWFAAGDSNPELLDDADADGMPNLLSYAFDRNPHDPRNSAGFLPYIEMAGSVDARHLRITFRRRKSATSSGLIYTPQFSSSPAGVWQDAPGTPVVTSISNSWEQVIIEDTVNAAAASRRFGRVKVEYGGAP